MTGEAKLVFSVTSELTKAKAGLHRVLGDKIDESNMLDLYGILDDLAINIAKVTLTDIRNIIKGDDDEKEG